METLEELTDVVFALQYLKNSLPLGNNVAIINTGGGIAVEITDTCEANGFNVAELDTSTQDLLQKLLPSVNVIIKNPVDLGGVGFNPEVFGAVIKYISQDPNIDIILTVHEIERFQNLNVRFDVTDIGEIYAQTLQKYRNPKKPIISILPRSWEIVDHFITYQNYRNDLLGVDIPSYPTPIRAITTLKKLLQYNKYLRKC